RAIGDPSERFGEDYLRILRAVRFAARLGYRIDPATTAALEACGPNLRSISRERIGGELRLMLEHRSAAEAVELIQRYGLDGPVLDEPPSDAPPKLLRAVVAAEAAPFELSLAAWSIDRHLDGSNPESLDLWLENLELFKPRALARRWRRALMLSNRQHDRLESLCVRFSDGLNWQALTVAARKRLMAEPIWPMLLRLIRAAVEERGARPFDLESFAQQQRLYQDQGVRPDPLIDGHHLIEAGLKPGPRFKSILEKVYDAQLEGTVTDRDAALKMALELT
ncbi:MAG: hypothetical protein R3236_10460, partial [Phycisphaeraceae bacterium]|nr:hypothetical protein [Phycisphaeraceae bacterium]